ncbi:YkgJ family cysteine cluster protein [Candidatus Micrarchaeota archaeon]|nr:YkgJ family cysteine cluster protein [Candidatus Micrarchaeota archaeon]
MFNPCSLCPASCCKTYIITTTSFDVQRVCQATGKKHEEFAVLHELRLLNYDPDMVLNTTDRYGHYILGFKSHPCTFLENNRCSIYESAPLSCRHFPYTVGNMNTRFCPLPSQLFFRLKGPETDKTILLTELKLYKEIVKEWNEKSGTKDDCINFLLGSSISH